MSTALNRRGLLRIKRSVAAASSAMAGIASRGTPKLARPAGISTAAHKSVMAATALSAASIRLRAHPAGDHHLPEKRLRPGGQLLPGQRDHAPVGLYRAPSAKRDHQQVRSPQARGRW